MGPIKIFETLLVENNVGNARLIMKVFDRFIVKNKVHVVEDSVKALEYLYKRGNYKDAKTPDLIILSLNLPEESSIELLNKINGDEKLRLIPIICLNNFPRWWIDVLNHSVLFKVLTD